MQNEYRLFQRLCNFYAGCQFLFIIFSKLRHIRACRDEEVYLMRDDKRWQLGTYYGEERYPDDANIFRNMYSEDTKPFERRTFVQLMFARMKHLADQVM